MNDVRCSFEDELLDALGRGYVRPDLDAHTASCASCSELRLVAGALLDERVQAAGEARVPTAGTMWWRMQMRRRQEVQAAARRTLLVGQAATLVVALLLVASFFGAEVSTGTREVIASIRLSTPLLVGLVTSAVLAPLAGWVAVRQK